MKSKFHETNHYLQPSQHSCPEAAAAVFEDRQFLPVSSAPHRPFFSVNDKSLAYKTLQEWKSHTEVNEDFSYYKSLP